MNTAPETRRGLGRLLRSRAGKAIAVLSAFALLCVGVVVGVTTVSAQAVETKGKYSGSGGSMKVTTITQQMLQIECFSEIAKQIKYLDPNVTRPVWAPKNITSTSEAFTPPTSDIEPFMQVLGTKKTGSMGTVPASMINTGQPVQLYKFVLYFKTPVANPRLNLAGTEMTQMANGVPTTSSGLSVGFSDAYAGYTGKKTAILSTNRVSGIDAVDGSAYRIEGNTIIANTVACDGNGGTCGDNPDARLAAVKAKIPSITRLTVPLRGTVELNTNGVPVNKVTVTVGATFFSAKDGAQSIPVPGLGIAPQFRSEVSAFQRTLGKYGHAMHAMPYVGAANLKFGDLIVEGNRNRYTNELNSGTADDNSDAGYDAKPLFYWEGDKSKTPVTSVSSANKGKWLMAEIKVTSGRTDKTAWVYGFLDWTGIGDFAKVDKGKSTLGSVSKGNGTVKIKWKVPSKVTSEAINLRLRVAYDCCEIDKPTGTALSGEVEDLPGVFNQQKNNLKVTKSVSSGASVRAGDEVTYLIGVQHLDARATSRAVTITDAFPAELRDLRISTPATAGTATLSGLNLTWQLPAGLTGDQSVRVTGTVVDGTPAGDVTNTARLNALCDPGNCEASASFTVMKDAMGELILTKQVGTQTSDPVRAGDKIGYVVSMAYTGDAPLNSVAFTDTLIPNIADWNCLAPIPTTVNSGWSNRCRTTYTVTEQDVIANWDAGELVNTARIVGTLSVAPGTELSKEASASVALDKATPRLDITGSKAVAPLAVVPGQTATYTIVATNNGQLTARDVVLLDAFEGATPAPIDPADCTWDGVIGELAPGDSATCTVTYTATDADANTTLVNTATATATDAGAPYGPVTLGSAELTINAPSLTIDKSNSLVGNPPIVVVGDTFTYTITVTNNGTAAASGIRILDDLPEGLILDPATQPGWTVDPGDPRRLTSDPFDLAIGESTDLTFVVRVTEEASGSLQNVVIIDGYTTFAACRATPTGVGCGRDENPPSTFETPISVSKSSDVAEDEQIWVGRTITYTLSVTNQSDQRATDVIVVDRLPDELEPYPTPQDGWSISGQVMSHDPFVLEPGETASLTLTARARSVSDSHVRNWVAVSHYTLEPNSGGRSAAPNNSASGVTAPDLAVEECPGLTGEARCAFADIPPIKARQGLQTQVFSTAPATVKAGDGFEYMIVLVNTSGQAATKVPVTHALPSGLEFDGKQDSVWRVDGRTATADVNVPARSAVALWLTVKVSSGASGPLQAFTMTDGALLVDCQADWKRPGCVADANAPIAS